MDGPVRTHVLSYWNPQPSVLRCASSLPVPDGIHRLSEHSITTERLSFLNARREVLLVLNHPLWDEKVIGSDAHQQELHGLLTRTGCYLHALELNGLRLAENSQVIRVANEAGLQVVSGGDRHGCEPNSILNLCEASSFSEFVEEIRKYRRSHVVFMPQHWQPLNWRAMRTVVDILRIAPAVSQDVVFGPNRSSIEVPTLRL